MTQSASDADLITLIVDQIFAVNGGLIAAGDALTAPVGLTAAQWQVLGFLEDGPGTAAQVARRRGLRRQSVQETVNRLLERGMLVRQDNPLDARSPVLILTEQARAALDGLAVDQRQWAQHLQDSFQTRDLQTTLDVLVALRAALGVPPRHS